MKRTPAIVAGLLLTVLGGSASAQWRANGVPIPHVFPQMHDQHPAPVYHAGPPPPPPPPASAHSPSHPNFPNDSLGAGWSAQQDAVRAGVNQRRYVPLGQAIESIRRRDQGRELDAGLEQWDGRPAYRVRWAEPDGRRIDYMVDAESGAILGVDEGR
jgi:hypothetical protein